jgi:hypothetical protein
VSREKDEFDWEMTKRIVATGLYAAARTGQPPEKMDAVSKWTNEAADAFVVFAKGQAKRAKHLGLDVHFSFDWVHDAMRRMSYAMSDAPDPPYVGPAVARDIKERMN